MVLPFDNMSGDAEQEYFADGITEDIITDISKVSGMFVIARNSSFAYKGKAVNLTQVGRELGVQHVLEGSVRKAGNRVRITAQLIDAAAAGISGPSATTANLDDIFAVQDEVTREIVKALQVTLTKDDKARIAAHPTENLEAWELFVRGREFAWRLDPGAHLEARRLFSDAIALDESFVDAIALLGFTYMLDIANPIDQSRHRARHARPSSERAASRSTPRGLIRTSSCRACILWSREFDEALAAEDRCLALDPNFPQGRAQRGFILHYVGRSAEAIDELNQAMRLDPLMPEVFLHTLAQCHFALGDDEEAARVLRRRIAIRPETDISRVLLAAALGHLGRHEEARHEWAGARAINPRYSFREKRAVLPYRDSGDDGPHGGRSRESGDRPGRGRRVVVRRPSNPGGSHGRLRECRYE